MLVSRTVCFHYIHLYMTIRALCTVFAAKLHQDSEKQKVLRHARNPMVGPCNPRQLWDASHDKDQAWYNGTVML